MSEEVRFPEEKTGVHRGVCMAISLSLQSEICAPGQFSQRRKSDFQSGAA